MVVASPVAAPPSRAPEPALGARLGGSPAPPDAGVAVPSPRLQPAASTAAGARRERRRAIEDGKYEKYRVSGDAARRTRSLLPARPPRYVRRVTPDELKALRKELACTAKELAAAIGLEQSTVMAWEKGDLFPTKPYIDKMNALRAKGPGAIPKKSKGGDPMQQLKDPLVWELLRKIAAHKKLRDEVAKMAAGYPDPADEPGKA